MIIYKVKNNLNDKCYIGQTSKTLAQRKRQHKNSAKRGMGLYFYNAIRKYGWDNFKWSVIEECKSKVELDEMEYHYIKQYDTYNNGYNLSYGGDGGDCGNQFDGGKTYEDVYGKERAKEIIEKMSIGLTGLKRTKETKQKIREANLGEKNPMFNKEHTEEAKKKISDAMKGDKNPFYGKTHTEETKKKLSEMFSGDKSVRSKKYIVITPDGKRIKVKGLRKFCREYKKVKLYHQSLIKCAQGEYKQSKGFKCIYDE